MKKRHYDGYPVGFQDFSGPLAACHESRGAQARNDKSHK
jgi:hypothetical protein